MTVAGLMGQTAAPWVVAAAVVVELGHRGPLNGENVKHEVVLGGQSLDEDPEKVPG